jgi:uncharacterized protein YecE (DUF72 family)
MAQKLGSFSRTNFDRGVTSIRKLPIIKRTSRMTPLIGTSGFQYPAWKGNFYPAKLPASKMLGFYAAHFPTTEINYTFRNIPTPKAIEGWAQSTPESFRFSFKAPQKITHFAKLRDCADKLLQLPPAFKRDAALLEEFLNSLPRGLLSAFEFRHESWFDEPIFASLNAHNVALCIAESDDFTTPNVVTADFGYLRLRKEKYRRADIIGWAEFVQTQQDRWSQAFIYFKHEETGTGPEFAQKLINKLKTVA